MRVWIDADACPKAAKDQVIKFALKRQFEVVLVAGQSQIKPTYALVKLIVVPSGPDAADDHDSILGLLSLGWVCFVAIWQVQLVILAYGMEMVRRYEAFAGPVNWKCINSKIISHN